MFEDLRECRLTVLTVVDGGILIDDDGSSPANDVIVDDRGGGRHHRGDWCVHLLALHGVPAILALLTLLALLALLALQAVLALQLLLTLLLLTALLLARVCEGNERWLGAGHLHPLGHSLSRFCLRGGEDRSFLLGELGVVQNPICLERSQLLETRNRGGVHFVLQHGVREERARGE